MSGTKKNPLRVTAVVESDTGDEALYFDGVFRCCDTTIYMVDLAKEADGRVLTLEHRSVEELENNWPEQLEDLPEETNG